MEQKLRSNRFDLDDFLQQMLQVRKMGPIEQIMAALPMFGGKEMPKVDEKELTRTQAIIQSMTKEERRDSTIINGSRRRRIARGSGTSVQEVNKLLNDFGQMRKMLTRANQAQALGGKRNARALARMPFR